jgi:hypothetical protein
VATPRPRRLPAAMGNRRQGEDAVSVMINNLMFLRKTIAHRVGRQRCCRPAAERQRRYIEALPRP